MADTHSDEHPAGKPVPMVRKDLEDFPQFALPEGYGFQPITQKIVSVWTNIQRDAEDFFPIADDLFRRQFGSNEKVFRERCFILTDPTGEAIGTISAWFDHDFGGASYGRVHWVAIRPSCQGNGLAKPMMTFCLEALSRWHNNAYLVTQEKRLPAISLYRKFGFRPYIASETDEQTWATILRKLEPQA